MAYCTNCGKEITAKKVCEHCGVKKNKTHNFCEWCGTALDQKAKLCPNCQEPKKAGTVVGKAVSTFFVVLFLISAIGAIGKSFVAVICFLLLALLLLPFTKGLIRKATHNNMKLRKSLKPVRVIVLVALFLIGCCALPESDTNYTEQYWNALTAMSEEEKEEEFRLAVWSGVSFYIITNYDVKEGHNIVISTVDVDGNTYTAYGKVTVTDNYGDRYTGKFTAVYEFNDNTQKFDRKSVDVGDLIRN